ncbi:hypothetical protein [Paenibacillus humicola]|uniref:hypothetical protein n=1 Tax=Paenibacillus humicola TaxID=3110540 RepID=UPI00237BAFF0|nr:hypothetical protein [Paenibacillus humicola]
MGRNQEFDYNDALDNAKHLFWNQDYEKTSVQQLTECMRIILEINTIIPEITR